VRQTSEGTSQNITNGKKLTTKTTFEQCITILKSYFLNLIVTDLSGFLTLFHSALYDAMHLYAVIHDGPWSMLWIAVVDLCCGLPILRKSAAMT
jgi:hypothetical protein